MCLWFIATQLWCSLYDSWSVCWTFSHLPFSLHPFCFPYQLSPSISVSNFSLPCISCYPIWPNLPPLIPPLSPPSVVYNGMSSKIWSAVFLKVTEPSKESQPKCWGEWGREWVRLWKGRGEQGGRDKRLAEWRMRGGEGRRAEGKAAGESSAVMEERNGAMEGKERGGGWGNLLFYDTSDLVTDEYILNM